MQKPDGIMRFHIGDVILQKYSLSVEMTLKWAKSSVRVMAHLAVLKI